MKYENERKISMKEMKWRTSGGIENRTSRQRMA